MNPFDDIRSYSDDEVLPTINTLAIDSEFKHAMQLLAKSNANKYTRWLVGLLFPLLWPLFWRHLTKGINDIHSMQLKVKDLLLKSLASSSDGLVSHGIEQLDPTKNYIFISNHRDIAMDPALINLILNKNGFGIPHLAIGDNLLSKAYASDIMRLNRSFIVKRNVQGGRKLLAELKKLSEYIQYLKQKKSNVWVAQREGRAKDGIDGTEEAVLKMLLLGADKKLSLEEKIIQLNIVPVAISYEWDPCDIDKATSLVVEKQTGQYIKSEHEDITTIGRGIAGYKGNIQVNFAPCIEQSFDSTEALATFIDEQINNRYQLFPCHFAACELLGIDYNKSETTPDQNAIDKAKQQFKTRLNGQKEIIKQRVLQNYANALININ